jgi:HEAT repeat protein
MPPRFDQDFQEMERRMAEVSEKLRELRVEIPPIHIDLPDLEFEVPEIDVDQAVAQASMALAQIGPLDFPQLAQANPPQPPQPVPAPAPRVWAIERGRASEERLYREGSRALDRREWDRAVEAFDAVIEKKESRADAAHYWKAYALSKLGRRNDALETISALQKAHPNSRWMNDARALEIELKRASGQPVAPEKESDEDLKLIAINSLMGTDPERAVPLLEGILTKHNSPKLKERALFVLAQSRSPQAKDVVVRFAKGQGNPDLQMKAIEYLGVFDGRDNLKILSEIYASATDPALKKRILHSFMVAGDRERVLNAAKGESNPDLRRDAIHHLGAMGAQAELGQLYTSESDPKAREAILHAFMISGNTDKLMEAAKSEKDAELRRKAIHLLGTVRRQNTGDALIGMYSSEKDPAIRREIIQALFIQENVKGIIDIARKESDPGLKREAVQRLSHMKSKEATDFMLELLNK